MSRGKVSFTALYREGCNTTGTLPMSPLHEWLSSLIHDIGPRASLASISILITPSDPRPLCMTEVIQACGKFRGSSTFLPFTSLKVFDELRLDLMMMIQDPLIHPANLLTRVMVFFFLFSDVSGPHPPNCRWMSSAAVSLEMRRVKLLLLLLVAVSAWWVVLPTAAEGGWVPSFDEVSVMSGLGEAWTLVEVWMEVILS